MMEPDGALHGIDLRPARALQPRAATILFSAPTCVALPGRSERAARVVLLHSALPRAILAAGGPCGLRCAQPFSPAVASASAAWKPGGRVATSALPPALNWLFCSRRSSRRRLWVA